MIHDHWRRLETPLTDFLIGFVLYELYAASWIWSLTPLIEQLQTAPEQMTPLVTRVFGSPHKISLYDEDILVMQRSNWKKPDHWEFAVRDNATLAKLGRFAGTLMVVGFQLTDEVADYEEPRIWNVRFKRDESGTFSSSCQSRWLSRDSFPAGVTLFDDIVAQIEAVASDMQSAACPIKVEVL